MTSVTRIGNVDHTLAARRARRDHADIDRPTLMDVHREIAGLPVGHPRRIALFSEADRIVRQRQFDAFPPDGPAAA